MHAQGGTSDTDVSNSFYLTGVGENASGNCGADVQIFRFDHDGGATTSSDSVDSIVVSSIGDLNLASSSFFFDRSTNYLGIGDTTPSDELHIRAATPAIRLEDSNDSTRASFDYDAGLINIEGNTDQDIVELTATAPDRSIFVNPDGEVGLGGDPNTHWSFADLAIIDAYAQLVFDSTTDSQWFMFQLSNGQMNFVMEDSAGTSNTFPFTIYEDTPNFTLNLTPDGVGIGTTTPVATVHVYGTDGTTQFRVEEASGAEATRTMFDIRNNGVGYLRLTDTSPDGSGWTFQAEGPSFRFNKAGTGGAEIFVRSRNDGTGGQATLTVDGSVDADNVSFTSSRKAKMDLTAVDSVAVLQNVLGLPISEWTFKDELNGRRHIGPMAEEFVDTFGLGGNAEHISLIDASGVTLAAIQGLYALLEEKNATIEELMTRVAALEAQLSHQ
jgi:hypothetical protein